MFVTVYGIVPNNDYNIWPWGDKKPFKTENEYKFFSFWDCDEISYDNFHEPTFINMIRHTINRPRMQNILNFFGLGFFYLAKDDI